MSYTWLYRLYTTKKSVQVDCDHRLSDIKSYGRPYKLHMEEKIIKMRFGPCMFEIWIDQTLSLETVLLVDTQKITSMDRNTHIFKPIQIVKDL